MLRNLLFAYCALIAAHAPAQEYEWQEFESIGFSRYSHPLVSVSKEGKKYYYHLDSKLLIDEVENRAAGMAVVIKDGAYGVLRDDGVLIVPFAYDGVTLENDYQGQWYDGIPYHYKFVALQKDGRYGYADTNGRVLVEPVYERLKVINKQIIAVAKDNRWGWLDAATGQLLNPCTYDEVNKTYGFDNYVSVTQDGRSGVAKKDGTIVVPVTEERLFFPSMANASYISGLKGGIATLYDSLGNVVFRGSYPSLQPMQNSNLFTFKRDDLLGVIDSRSGRMVFEPQFTSVRTCVRGLCQVAKANKNGVINDQGHWILQPHFDHVEYIAADGRTKADAVIYTPSFYNNGNNGRSPAQESRISFEAKMDGLPYYIRAQQGTTVGLFDWEGEPLVQIGMYTSIKPHYHNGKLFFIVTNQEGKMGVLDATGKTLLPLRYGHNTSYQYNTRAIEARFDIFTRYMAILDPQGDGAYPACMGLFDLETATVVVEPKSQSIEWLSENYFKVITRSEDYRTQVSLYNGEGNHVLAFDSDIKDIRLLRQGVLLAEQTKEYSDGIYLLMDTTGRRIYANPNWVTRGSFGHIRFPENEQWKPYDFHAGLKKIYADEANLFVNEYGEEVRFPDYEQVDGFYGGHALVGKKVVSEDRGSGFWFGGSRYLFGLVDSTGAVVFPPIWHSVHAHANDPARLQVQLGEKFGLIDRTGRTVLEAEYDYIESSSNKPYIQIKKGDKMGMVTSDGEVVIEPNYEMVRTNSEGEEKTWPLLVKEGKWHYFIGKGGKPYSIRAKAYTY